MSMLPCTKSPIFCFVTVLDANAKCPIYFFFLFFFSFNSHGRSTTLKTQCQSTTLKWFFSTIKHWSFFFARAFWTHMTPWCPKRPWNALATHSYIKNNRCKGVLEWFRDASRRRGLRQKFWQKRKKSSWILKLWYFWTAALHNITLVCITSPIKDHFCFSLLVTSTFSLQGKKKKYLLNIQNPGGKIET